MQTTSLFPATILHLLPEDVGKSVLSQSGVMLDGVSEIRLRIGRRVQLVGPDVFLPVVVEQGHLRHVLATLTRSSLYAVEAELRHGFITLPGGHRVGIAGKVVLGSEGGVQTVRDISSVNIRIAKGYHGCAKELAAALCKSRSTIRSALLFGPPSSGKTTLLRDLARMLGSGEAPFARPHRVTLVDERSEIAGSMGGAPQFDVGLATDVLDACPKSIGMTMALRSLSPEVVIVDELGGTEDALAVADLARAGVALVGTAHAGSVQELFARFEIMALARHEAIERFVEVSPTPRPGTVKQIYDRQRGEVKLWRG